MFQEKGQSLVEFGIAFLFIMFLLSGMVELGISLFQYVQLRDAVQEGAVYGSYCNCGLGEIENRIRHSSASPLDLKDDSVSIQVKVKSPSGFEKPLTSACEKDALEVRAIYAHRIFMPFLPKILGSPDILLNASVTNTVLHPICS